MLNVELRILERQSEAGITAYAPAFSILNSTFSIPGSVTYSANTSFILVPAMWISCMCI
jgi:hypothetical protein